VNKRNKLKYYSALEVANMCGVVNQTAINWINRKYLKAFTTPGGQYRVSAEELALFLVGRGMKIPPELKGFAGNISKTILLIEDDDLFAGQILDQVHSEYPLCFVDRALDGFEAGVKLAVQSSDLILLNGDMNGLNVHRVCESIRSGREGEYKSIIIFTGMVDNIEKESLLKAGADVYLEKPFDIGQISIYLE
jgi:CheY-like chemotaxis protein